MTACFFQQSNQVALKQLLMQVSEKSITQMGYGPQDSRPFLVFIAGYAKNARDLSGPHGSNRRGRVDRSIAPAGDPAEAMNRRYHRLTQAGVAAVAKYPMLPVSQGTAMDTDHARL
ncbi:hypothetical protein [Rhizobium lentis]|uniref:Uncharacterized protein n=1 Tax=Rhizobium lentis TaxID=1138194 RepID=A0A7W8XHB0_9HYPH|nr:hypothetical protein [Rhizobium lentis]MBB5552564.1 hypothetical protein [Rhizobium lentis]MBB5562826.1 hypothetical protein [Rhizobium lentis]MBB5569381.1 hypothetical protein [Rhizobium lentis]